jgi:hypothetical protein
MRHALWFVIAFAVVGCGGSSDDGTSFDDGGGGSAASGAGGSAGADGSAGSGATSGGGGVGASDANNADLIGNPDGNGCGTTQCTDCLDNDGDGLIDSNDPDCTGPLDDDESSFATGIPGDNKDACKQDCFFDGNSGSGDDGCEWSVGCENPSPDPSCAAQNCDKQQVQACKDFCLPLVPNGCDCFGCCEFPDGDGGTVDVWITNTCDSTKLADPVACPRCQFNTDCGNPCGHCELCVGKTELPPDCFADAGSAGSGGAGGSGGGDSGTAGSGGTPQQCPYGETSCDANHPCIPGYYCLTGCCIVVPH